MGPTGPLGGPTGHVVTLELQVSRVR
jgi:hypothetical protein